MKKVRTISGTRSVALAARVLRRDGHHDLADKYEAEGAALTAHTNALRELSERTKFGTALGVEGHATALAEWLVEQGWTPPAEGILWDEVVDDEPDSP
jgi:hypothetical protein